MPNLTNVLHFHGVTGTGNAILDNARDAGILWACLGCGSVAVAPDGMTTEDWHTASGPSSRTMVNAWSECCPDADSVVF